ncbi:MAG: hypothetical protein HZB44_06075 [Actinobacteria bacterium]|nr:hypothetical protein [Actinomycetota bacterium]
MVDELQEEYKDKIEFIRYDLSTTEGYCEYQLLKVTHIPAMLFVGKNGDKVEVTDTMLQKPELKQKLDNLLAW